MKACILGATFNTANMGVSMLAAGAIRCVLARFPEAAVVLMDYAREAYQFDFAFGGRTVPVRFVNLRFSKRWYLANNIALLIFFTVLARLIPARSLRNKLLARNPYLAELLSADLVFAVSGGDSFSDIYGLGRFFYVALPQLLALLAGKRLILLPQTVGPFESGLVKTVARFILGNAEAVYLRERKGLEPVRALLGRAANDPRLRFCYDMAFDVEPAPPAQLGIEGIDVSAGDAPLAGFNVSGLLWAGGYTQSNMFALKSEYRDAVRELIRFLIEDKGARVLLVPHVFGGPESMESDTEACRGLYAELAPRYPGRIGFAAGRYGHREIKHVIGLCAFFVGARMHACIGAISQGVPAVLMAYSDKFEGVMQAIGLERLVVDARRMDSAEMVRVLNEIFEGRAGVRSELAQRMPEVRETIRGALSGVVLGEIPA